MELKKQGREHGEREHQMRGQDLAAGAVRGSRARLPARRGDRGGRALGVQAARGGAATARVDVRRDLEALKMGMANNATMTRTDEIAYVDAAIDVYCPRYVRLTGTLTELSSQPDKARHLIGWRADCYRAVTRCTGTGSG
jgi:hypothetical protein